MSSVRVADLIARLQQRLASGHWDQRIGMTELVELAFPNSRALAEYRARAKIILQIARAKTDAGFPRSVVFFTTVWPAALAALKNSRAGTVPPPSRSTVNNNRCPSADRSLSDVKGSTR